MSSSPANAYNNQQMDACNGPGQQVDQYGTGYCATGSISRQDFDFPSDISLSGLSSAISGTRQQQVSAHSRML
ncbi:unnamed protein product [Toxocara canis]|uniref:Uncharacterized protein n=1 Tax=Toxocara canis TaxID=6265 RepID=A0A183V133_TOXCA|nr:unnamed protein product [Toxocara canis]